MKSFEDVADFHKYLETHPQIEIILVIKLKADYIRDINAISGIKISFLFWFS
jgi:hypothetical protein